MYKYKIISFFFKKKKKVIYEITFSNGNHQVDELFKNNDSKY